MACEILVGRKFAPSESHQRRDGLIDASEVVALTEVRKQVIIHDSASQSIRNGSFQPVSRADEHLPARRERFGFYEELFAEHICIQKKKATRRPLYWSKERLYLPFLDFFSWAAGVSSFSLAERVRRAFTMAFARTICPFIASIKFLYAASPWMMAAALTTSINRLVDWCVNLFKRRPGRPKMRVTYKRNETDYEYNARKHQETVELDAILDKLKRSGYESLSAEEKKRLFDASGK